MAHSARHLIMAVLIACGAQSANAERAAQSGTIGLHCTKGGLGRTVILRADMPDLTPLGFYQTARSITLPPGDAWEICTRPNYGGRCVTIDNDVPSLKTIGMEFAVASVRKVRH